MLMAIQQTEEFEEWLDGLADLKTQGVIRDRLIRAEGGNLGDAKPLGDKVGEMIVDYGPGYRLYFTKMGLALVILLCGGAKRSQARDIKKAKALAAEIWAAS
jgi:putative addiction module killer protein